MVEDAQAQSTRSVQFTMPPVHTAEAQKAEGFDHPLRNDFVAVCVLPFRSSVLYSPNSELLGFYTSC